jgi:hypothetical protein
VNDSEPDRPRERSCYEIRLQGRLDQRWSTWFDGLTLSTDQEGSTTLRGPVADQAALHGLLARVRDLGVPLISLRRLENDACEPTTPARSQP